MHTGPLSDPSAHAAQDGTPESELAAAVHRAFHADGRLASKSRHVAVIAQDGSITLRVVFAPRAQGRATGSPRASQTSAAEPSHPKAPRSGFASAAPCAGLRARRHGIRPEISP